MRMGAMIAVLVGLVGFCLPPAVAAEDAPGQGEVLPLFADSKCALCHSVASLGIAATTKLEKVKGPDLGGFVTETPEALYEFLTKAVEIDGEKHKKEFKGTLDELNEILLWLAAQEAVAEEAAADEAPAEEAVAGEDRR